MLDYEKPLIYDPLPPWAMRELFTFAHDTVQDGAVPSFQFQPARCGRRPLFGNRSATATRMVETL